MEPGSLRTGGLSWVLFAGIPSCVVPWVFCGFGWGSGYWGPFILGVWFFLLAPCVRFAGGALLNHDHLGIRGAPVSGS